jgi:hypothetical protein
MCEEREGGVKQYVRATKLRYVLGTSEAEPRILKC